MNKFKLECNKWYACTLISESFNFDVNRCTYSPIKILDIEPSTESEDSLAIFFYHANYPEGVRGKYYELQILELGQSLLFARCLGYERARFIMIFDITKEWLFFHFKEFIKDKDKIYKWLNQSNIQDWLDKNIQYIC